MNYNINLANESTRLDQIVTLLLELDKIHHDKMPSRFPLYSSEKRLDDLRCILNKGSIFYVEDLGKIIAFASVIKKGESLVIEHLYVQKEHRYHGIATSLVNFIFEQFPDDDIFVSVYAFNQDAIKFYEKFFSLSSLIFKKNR